MAAPADAERERLPLLDDEEATRREALKQREVEGSRPRDRGQLGFYLQYFAVGIIYGGRAAARIAFSG